MSYSRPFQIFRHAHCWGFLLVLAITTIGSVLGGFPKDCGLRKLRTTLLIHGGRETKIANWPWHTAIYHRKDATFEYKCGGTILAKNIILTAAHCVRLPEGIISSERLAVQVGRNRLNETDERAKEHEADAILVHENFRTDKVQDDIALIRLATDIEFNDYVQPVCLWDKGDDRLFLRENKGSIVGFGATGKAGFSVALNEAEIPVVDNQVCIESNREAFAFTLTSNMFCGGRRDGVNACNGDSGGGMFFLYGDRYFVRGVVSFSPSLSNGQCDPYEYVVFTDVARYVQWITKTLNATFVEAPARSDVHPKLRLLSQDICGYNPQPFDSESEKPVFLTYPWVGLIEYTEQGFGERKIRCHALLISERYLVTAAQCVYNTKKLKPVAIRLGEYDSSNAQDCDQIAGQRVCAPPTQTHNIETITIHQQYNKPRFANDIALIRLRQLADISQDNVKPICLPLNKVLRSYKPATFTRAGWKASSSQPVMQRSEVAVVESVACQELYHQNRISLAKTFRQICIEKDPNCRFDITAAPLQAVQLVDGSPRYVLHGLLSFGPLKCHLQYPEVYTNVGTYLNWILDNIHE
ncbi:CLIP domain-containing serine protease B15-like [Uranotaenia lowii]|uniref:CLIP domain-containing serine protease B15-like n=1 Tax=Uranotaenia lowii TaxID=190385 RepID=UPI0024799950|nr:CLIP domain-containing serine protease B15-like [Uranotaenia lowii]